MTDGGATGRSGGCGTLGNSRGACGAWGGAASGLASTSTGGGAVWVAQPASANAVAIAMEKGTIDARIGGIRWRFVIVGEVNTHSIRPRAPQGRRSGPCSGANGPRITASSGGAP
ncbi:hypothetical protein GCM10023332_03210 [Luteimonas vadosa]|uniref:Uncharacterized protein n=1 Tax=Luteimonas vadosa TaxID=1165507 RepID=A0ABP9DSU1_9GAMM